MKVYLTLTITYYTFIAIPLPTVRLVTIGSVTLGDSISVICSVDVLDDLYNIAVNISIVRIDQRVIAVNYSTGDTSVSLSIESLMTSNAGQYQCRVNVTQSTTGYEFSNVTSFNINTTSKYSINY